MGDATDEPAERDPTAADLQRLTGEIGLAEVIDLCSDEEVSEDGRGGIAERARIHHVPLFPDPSADRRSTPSTRG